MLLLIVSTLLMMPATMASPTVHSLEVEILSSGWLRARWQPGNDSGEQPIDGYVTKLTGVNNSTYETLKLELSETTKDLDINLTDAEYIFSVAAFRSDGPGGARVVGPKLVNVTIVPAMNDAIKDAPPDLTDLAPGESAVKLSWKPKADDGIKRIVRFLRVDSFTTFTGVVVADDETAEIQYGSDLVPYREYYGTLQTCVGNDKDCGAPLRVTFWTLIGAPNPPSDLTVINYDREKVEFTWIAPSMPNSPGVDHYLLNLKTNAETISNKTFANESLTSNFEGLESGTKYTIEVYAVNVNEKGEYKMSKPLSTDFSTPPAILVYVIIFIVLALVIVVVASIIFGQKYRLKKSKGHRRLSEESL